MKNSVYRLTKHSSKNWDFDHSGFPVFDGDIIGRRGSIKIKNAAFSGKHGKFNVINDELYYTDNNSTNGSYKKIH